MKKNLLLALPAIVVVMLLGAALIRVAVNAPFVEKRYRAQAKQAMQLGDFSRAKVYLSRFVENQKDVEPSDLFDLAIILDRTGDHAASIRLLEKLAPDHATGYAPAHRARALIIASSLSRNANSDAPIHSAVPDATRNSTNPDAINHNTSPNDGSRNASANDGSPNPSPVALTRNVDPNPVEPIVASNANHQNAQTNGDHKKADPDTLTNNAEANPVSPNASNAISRNLDPHRYERLRHHLNHAEDDSSIEIVNAWIQYYLALNQPDEALGILSKAARNAPELLIAVARLQSTLGRTEEARYTLSQATQHYQQALDKDPLAQRQRILLATVLAEQEKYDAAESLIADGIRLQDTREIRNIGAILLVKRFDSAVAAKRPFAELLSLLNRALTLDRDYPPVYARLNDLHAMAATSADREVLRQSLAREIAAGNVSPLAHFALGNLLYADGKISDAVWHWEKAYKLDQGFSLVANNLAWTLAHQNQPDLDRALALAQQTVNQFPNDARFRDTLGTILMRRGDLDQAVIELERSLPGMVVKKSIHYKLAEIYRALGKPQLAAAHEELIQ